MKIRGVFTSVIHSACTSSGRRHMKFPTGDDNILDLLLTDDDSFIAYIAWKAAQQSAIATTFVYISVSISLYRIT